MNTNTTKNRQIIQVQFPILDSTESVANIKTNVTSIEAEIITIEDIFIYEKSSIITIINFGTDEIVKIIAGDAYPNSMLGDVSIQIPYGISQIAVKDLARFVKTNESLDIEFPKNFNGCIYATSTLH